MKRSLARTLVFPLAAAAVLLSAVTASAVAGWRIDEIDGDFPDDPVRYYYAGTAVRIENLVLGLDYLLDLEEGTVFIVDDNSAAYAGGSFGEVTEELSRHMENRRKNRDGEGAGERAAAVIADLRIEKLEGGKVIAGFTSGGYRVYLGDLLVEEVWLAPEIDAVTTGSAGALFLIMEAVTGGEGGDNDEFPPMYEKDGGYRDLMNRGYPVRRSHYFLDIESLTEVVAAERRDLSQELFAVPRDYERVTYLELFSGRN